jgi:hypothetical protein
MFIKKSTSQKRKKKCMRKNLFLSRYPVFKLILENTYQPANIKTIHGNSAS